MSMVLAQKGSAANIKTYARTPLHARRLSNAIRQITRMDADTLPKSRRVHRIDINGRDNLFEYRISPYERIIFSIVDKKVIIHDIVDLKNRKSLNNFWEKE